jgi:multisubunit Na+/H+ antiporter MnhE subunit
MTRFLVSLVLLTLLWGLALSSFDPVDLLIGALLSAALLWFLRDFLFSEGLRRPLRGLPRRILGLIPYAVVVLLDVIRGTWEVSLVSVRLRPLRRPGIVAVPMGERSNTGVAVTALAMTLSPGSVLVDVDWDRRLLWFHFLDASDPDGLREQQQRMYDRWQRHVFP